MEVKVKVKYWYHLLLFLNLSGTVKHMDLAFPPLMKDEEKKKLTLDRYS